MTVTSAQIFVVVAATSAATFAISRHWERWRQMILSGIVVAFTVSLFYAIAMMALSNSFSLSLSDFWLPSPSQEPIGGVRWAVVPRSVARWQDEIEVAANECGIHPALLAAIVMKESSGNPVARGKAGEIGLVQLMTVTAREMGVTDRADPTQSLRGGACYLAKMIKRYDNLELGLAAYNAGPGNVDKRIIPDSTKAYGRIVMANFAKWRGNESEASEASEITGCCIWPTVGGYVSQMPNAADHMAYDIAVVTGTPIMASHGGRVMKVARLRTGYGHHIVIAGENGVSSLYAHLSHISVKHGDIVRQGQEIGRSGNTGRSTGPHLHFEIKIDGERVNPARVIGSEYGG